MVLYKSMWVSTADGRRLRITWALDPNGSRKKTYIGRCGPVYSLIPVPDIINGWESILRADGYPQANPLNFPKEADFDGMDQASPCYEVWLEAITEMNTRINKTDNGTGHNNFGTIPERCGKRGPSLHITT